MLRISISSLGKFSFQNYKNLQREMDSGRVVSLFPDRLRTFRLTSNPIQSGRDGKRFDDISSSASFCSPVIESGITCFEGNEIVQLQDRMNKTIIILNVMLKNK